MRKIILFGAFVALSTSLFAQIAERPAPKKPEFTVIKEIPITSVKNQARSGTCWNYSTLSFFEAEILKKSGKTYDLCEMFVCNKNYMDRAICKVRMHGDAQFSQGGSAYDVLYVLKYYGICPEEAMPLPGTLYGDTLNNFNEFFEVMEPYVDAVVKSKAKTIGTTWRNGLQGILDAYLGKCPEEFTYEGKKYTPKTFAASLGLNWDDYVSITSYTHHPFYEEFPVEVQDNWRQPGSWNLPIDEMARVIENAIMNGYTVAWGGDVSEAGFTRDGLAILVDMETKATSGSDQERWVGRSEEAPAQKATAKELEVTQESRQLMFDEKSSTDDHGMHLYGIAKDQNGVKYYLIKNSWGETGAYKGIWYMSENFLRAKTLNIVVHKNAVPRKTLHRIGVK